MGELTQGTEEISDEELKMATTLVKSMDAVFEPEKYEDRYSRALQEIIEAKIKDEEITIPKIEEAEMPDLMTALRKSIEEAEKRAAEKEHASARD
jgi:DNA end-binding protein Ku